MEDSTIMREGITQYLEGNFNGSLTYFLSLPDNCGADPIELAYYIGLCYTRLKRYDDALLYLEQVVTASGDDSPAATDERVLQCRYLLAVIYCLSGRKKLSEFELNKLLETGFKPASVYASLAYMAWEQGDIEKSLSYYDQSLAADDENPTALNGLGYVLACESRDLTRALSCCRKALAIAPESAACLDSMGWIYYKMGFYSEARSFLMQAYKRDSGNPIIAEHLQELEQSQA